MFGKKEAAAEGEKKAMAEDALDSGIRDLVRSLEQDQFRELRAQLERQFAGLGPEGFRELQKKVEELERGLAGLRKDAAAWLEEVRSVKAMAEGAAALRKRVEEAAAAGAEGRESVRKEVAGLREAVAAAGKQQKELLQQAAEELRQLKERTQALAKLEDGLRSLKAEELRRDIEALKARSQWLEQNRPDTGALELRVAELEAKLARLRGTSPVVLE